METIVILGMPVKPSTCLYCQTPIKAGRTDKKFCHSGCKDAYNNAIKSEEQAEIRKINMILKKNRRALRSLYDPKKSDKLISREELIRAGFEFGFLTHIAITQGKSSEITFCYDYGYREVEASRYQLFQSFAKVQVKDGRRREVM